MNKGILDIFQTLAGILGETEPEHSLSQLVKDHLSLLLKELVGNGFVIHLSTNQAI